jgi:NAD(P)-dependent dehydrogenase (short-subunit alcohol dehydrogenase family)
MIILIGSSSGIANSLIEELSKQDQIIAFYNTNRPSVKKKYNKIYYEKINLKKKNNYEFIFKKYCNKLLNTKLIFINLAAITLDKLLLDVSRKNIIDLFNVNVVSSILIIKSLIPFMIKNNWGRIVHFTSTKALMGDVGISIYSSTKSSLTGLSNSLSKEYGRFNITSNIISLGYFDSPMWRRLKSEKQFELLGQVPSKTLGNPKNILNAINFIIKSDYLNSANIKLDGGI